MVHIKYCMSKVFSEMLQGLCCTRLSTQDETTQTAKFAQTCTMPDSDQTDVP